MHNQAITINKYEENNLQSNEVNRFLDCEEIVDSLVEQGLPKAFSPDNYISKISKSYGITAQEARTCLKLAIKQLEAGNIKEEKKEDKLYAQSGYFYPSGYSEKNSIQKPKDGMDSLSSLGSYNRLMFGLR